jgi:hypothetical protein
VRTWRRRPTQPLRVDLGLAGSSVRFVHLLSLRDDIRGEIKTRIQQRDSYSIQLIVALGVIFVVAFAQHGLDKVLIAAPLVSIYFTMLILYSYRIHDVLARYLRLEIEPRLADLVINDSERDSSRGLRWRHDLEWESWYISHGRLRPGLRRSFFYWISLATTIATLAYLWALYFNEATFRVVLIAMSAGYFVSLLTLTLVFRHELSPFRQPGNLESVPPGP